LWANPRVRSGSIGESHDPTVPEGLKSLSHSWSPLKEDWSPGSFDLTLQSVLTDFGCETGISIPGGLVGKPNLAEDNRGLECDRGRSASPPVGQGLKSLSHSWSPLKEDWSWRSFNLVLQSVLTDFGCETGISITPRIFGLARCPKARSPDRHYWPNLCYFPLLNWAVKI